MKQLLSFLFLFVTLAANAQTFPKSFTVAKDGSGDFKTVQEAVNAVRDLSEVQVPIYIKNGIYKEKLLIPAQKSKISLIGESREKTIITFDDYSGKNEINT